MLSIDSFEIVFPKKKMPVSELSQLTGLSREMLLVYRSFYCLKYIPIFDGDNYDDFILSPLKILLEKIDKKYLIRYLIYVHTAGFVFPYGFSLFQRIKQKNLLNTSFSWEMTSYKCVSLFKVMEILNIIF